MKLKIINDISGILLLIAICSLLCCSIWFTASYTMGFFIDKFFDLKNFSSKDYVAFGSFILVIVVIVDIVLITVSGWLLIRFGKINRILKQ